MVATAGFPYRKSLAAVHMGRYNGQEWRSKRDANRQVEETDIDMFIFIQILCALQPKAPATIEMKHYDYPRHSYVHPYIVVNFSHFRLLWNHWTEFTEIWQEAKTQRHLPSLCFHVDLKNKMTAPVSNWLRHF